MRLFSFALSAISLVAAMTVPAVLAADAPKGPKITNIVYFDIKVSCGMLKPLMKQEHAANATLHCCFVFLALVLHASA